MITKTPKKILIAEGKVSFKDKLSDVLKEVGHDVTYAFDGPGVIEELSKGAAGLGALIIDLEMPHVDGYGVIEWIRENALMGKFPILCITATKPEKDVEFYVRGLGASGIIPADMPIPKFVAAVNRYLFPDKQGSVRGTGRIYRTLKTRFMLGAGYHDGLILNFGLKGVFLNTTLQLVPGSLVRLEFSLAPFDETVLMPSGTVMWSTAAEEKNSRFAGAGVEFKALSDHDRKLMKKYIEFCREDSVGV
ncbi:MAG: response regulator [Deltaproteobacteria bacterium]|nr:response regulator [Deltaproteobacteria bacterium]